ncbi:hypothetical protein DOTSEDRAFT_71053 [Dothistroma septosporum NZE10]|uniref:Uncharacterized protein n=1 Tax=Dothistroma septosporum (strain NZE10 / CBS 128990) TaxID=675120 RepID=N1PP93_DOTSN|nr:hypothetical protein DOTSEDRAFT_71053 [Dothistroma septosporum NZE10]
MANHHVRGRCNRSPTRRCAHRTTPGYCDQAFRKRTVTTILGVCLLNAFSAAMNLANIARIPNAKDFAPRVVPSLMWAQGELLWSFIAASLPCLETFMRPFDKIDDDTWRTQNQYHPSARSGRSWREIRDRDGLVPLGDLRTNQERTVANASGSESMDLRPDVAGNSVEITGLETNFEDINHTWGSQERIIIKKQEEFEVTIEGSERMPYQIR